MRIKPNLCPNCGAPIQKRDAPLCRSCRAKQNGSKRGSQNWTANEKLILKSLYNKIELYDLMRLYLPTRSPQVIYNKASQFGLTNRHKTAVPLLEQLHTERKHR